MAEEVKIETDGKVKPAWYSMLIILLALSFFLMIGVTFYMWITRNPYWGGYLLITLLMAAYFAVKGSMENEKKIASLK